MLESLLLPDEKIISSRKISILAESRFWIGAACLVFSGICFVLISYFLPGFLTITGIAQNFGFYVDLSVWGGIPIVPVILLVAGFLSVLWAELEVYFKEYAVTNMRVIIKSGVINTDSNILLPAKIEDVNVDISLFERILGIGKVVVIMQQDSRPPVIMAGIRDPYKFQGDMLKLISGTMPRTNEQNGTDKTD